MCSVPGDFWVLPGSVAAFALPLLSAVGREKSLVLQLISSVSLLSTPVKMLLKLRICGIEGKFHEPEAVSASCGAIR